MIFKKMILVRLSETRHGTFGVLLDEDIMRGEFVPFATTLELRWRNNIKNGSCIPAGIYECRRIKSPKFGETFEIMNVPNREHIEFHWGNTIKDILGCIAVGEQFGILGGVTAILASKKGFKEFMWRLRLYDTFQLEIVQTLIKHGYRRGI